MDVRLVNDSTAILSMRESDFDAYSAYGEVIDNSIQANAQNIKVRIFSQGGRRGPEVIEKIAFGDDGDGMTPDILHHCLQLGYSTRFDDRSGIGRFGVGMKLAAINQCKRVEIHSKTIEGKWLWTYIDLDEISNDPPKLSTIPEPTEKSLPADCKDLVGKEKGTLVIWSKYDRQPTSTSDMIPEMHVWFGRTYRYFIWDGIIIELDQNLVKAIDPLYVCTENTIFPQDSSAKEYEPMKFMWPIHSVGLDQQDKEKSEITVRMSLIDESLRPNQGAGNAKSTTDRFIHMNQGVSILRNRREVFYDHIPYWPGKGKDPWFSEIDRWWGCEISFNAVLDRAFTVKNIKRGAVPITELKKTIHKLIAPTRQTCLDKIREVWSEAKQKKREEEKAKTEELSTGHEDAEKIADKAPVDKSAIDKDVDFDDAAQRLVEEIKRNQSEEKKAAWIAKWKSQPFTIEDDRWRGPAFIEAVHLGGCDVIKYNLAHPFFEKINEIIESLEEKTEEYENAIKLKQLIDLLLISYSKAEAKFEPDTTFTAKQFVENMSLNWGQYLSIYLGTWQQEDE